MANGEPDTLIMWKRIIDVALSLAALFVLAPVFFVVAMAILMESGSPVIFRQQRIGKAERTFPMLKFRSMLVGAEKIGPYFTVPDDQRITRVGKFIRRTSLDELPQFLNVLLGNMSVVGPRPHPLWLNDKYRDNIEKYMVRHFIKPGITGLAQVKGFRGETTDPAMMESRIKMDVFYLENWSFLLDIKIIFSTVFNVLKGDKNAF